MSPATPSRLQSTLDGLIDRSMLWAVPRAVRPNHLTALRFLLAPLVYALLVGGETAWGVAVLVVGLATDFLDGAMARTRDQITNLGIVIDPLADKLIVAVALLAVGSDYLVVRVILVLLVIETIGVAAGTLIWARTGEAVMANVYGKIKMVLLSVGSVVFLVGRLAGIDSIVSVGVMLLWVGLGFALASAAKQLLDQRRVRTDEPVPR